MSNVSKFIRDYVCTSPSLVSTEPHYEQDIIYNIKKDVFSEHILSFYFFFISLSCFQFIGLEINNLIDRFKLKISYL